MEHAEFVTNRTGCTQREVIYCFVVAFLALAVRNLVLPWMFLGRRYDTSAVAYWLKFVADLGFVVAPSWMVLTVWADELAVVAILAALVLVLVVGFVAAEGRVYGCEMAIKQAWNRIIDEQHRPTMFVTYLRSVTMVAVSVAILGVDFPVFPRRFAKTETFGHSAMDVGVSAFVFISGLGSRMGGMYSRDGRRKWYRSSTGFLVALGVIRAVSLEVIGYPMHVSEYGVHWNFFFTLAIVRIVYRILPKQHPLVFCVVFGVVQETILRAGYQEWVLADGLNERKTIIEANAEGILSVFGYLTIFYASVAVGDMLAKTCIRVKWWVRRCVYLYLLSATMFVLQLVAEYSLSAPSRRVVNTSYILSQLFLMILATAMCLSIQMFGVFAWCAGVPQFANGDDPFTSTSPCLCVSINRHALLYFLASNILTGMVNMLVDTHSTPTAMAMLILGAYLFIGAFLVHLVQFRRLFVENKWHSE